MRGTPHRHAAGSSGILPTNRGHALLTFLDEEGVTAIEYALLASLIAMVVLVSIMALGVTVQGMWQGVANAVSGAVG